MKENKRLSKLLKDHFNGDPWIDVQLLDSLKGLTAKEAARNINGLNSVWEIVQHMTCWRETLLQRIEGRHVPAPAHNYFFPLKDTSAAAWTAAIKQLKASQEALLDYLSNDNIAVIDEAPPGSNYSRYELLQGVLQHDAYHLGQIVLIRKMLKQ